MKFFTTLFLLGLFHISQAQGTEIKPFDWQGHRGARGLAPENAIPAFLTALSFAKITTLELDVVISADGKVVVSHEPWLNAKICLDAKGHALNEKKKEEVNLYKMDYKEIIKCDCGSRGNPSFPEQKAIFAYKPLLSDVVNEVRQYVKKVGKSMPQFNIEIKSGPSSDGIFTPEVNVFAEIVRKEIKKLKIQDISSIQSFDPRALRYLHEKDKELVLVYLVEKVEDVKQQIDLLGFTPAIYSPYFEKVTSATVDQCHKMGMKIVPWTVNDTEQMKKLILLGVDGIITDYPDRIPADQ
jgi:glycerophosphoryl diester phosphodiesterase